MEKKIIIVGAGISGLSAGYFAEKCGYKTEIFEMNNTPGGLCTSWNRSGYLMDGCIEWLIGSNPDSVLYDCWDELGGFDNTELIYNDYVLKYEASGKKLILYSDVDKLEKHLLEIAPEDSELICEFTDAIRKCTFFSKTLIPELNPKFNTMLMYDFLMQFKNSFLKDALSVGLLPANTNEYTVGGLVFRLSFYNRKDACWPVGGSLAFAQRIEKKYLSLGGKINYRTKVTEIIINNDCAKGIRLSDGTEHFADYIVSSIDAYSTLVNLLKGNYIPEKVRQAFEQDIDLPTSVQVSLGINCDLSEQPHCVAVKLDKPIINGKECNEYLFLRHYCRDKIISTPGKSVITSLLRADYRYWETLHKDIDSYILEKERMCNEVIKAAKSVYPQIADKIEVTDVVTPITYRRYADVWKGSYLGWCSRMENGIPTVLPGLEGFFAIGQWTQASGGIPGAMLSGKDCISNICKNENA